MRLREKPDLTGPSLFAAGPQMSGRPESLPLPPPSVYLQLWCFPGLGIGRARREAILQQNE